MSKYLEAAKEFAVAVAAVVVGLFIKSFIDKIIEKKKTAV